MKKLSGFVKFICLSMVMTLVFGLAGCTAKATNTTTAATVATTATAATTAPASDTTVVAGGKIVIGVSIADQSNVFYIDILDGMKAAMKSGDELVVMDAGFDPAKQITDIEDMIQQGVDAMLIDPVDSKGIQASLEACKAANIPVIAYNSPVSDASMVASTVASDNFMAGQLIGEELAKALNFKGDIAMLTYNVAQVCADRANGFLDALKQYPDMKVVDSQEIQPGVDTALPVMENILQSYPSLTGVFALNDPSAIGCAAAVESAGLLDKIKIVGVDGSDDGKKAITEGKMLASAAQHPVDIGKISIETAYSIISGSTVEANIKVPVELINKDNASK